MAEATGKTDHKAFFRTSPPELKDQEGKNSEYTTTGNGDLTWRSEFALKTVGGGKTCSSLRSS
jgi:hypothetical protein